MTDVILVAGILFLLFVAYVAGIITCAVWIYQPRRNCTTCKYGDAFNNHCPNCWKCMTEDDLQGYERKG